MAVIASSELSHFTVIYNGVQFGGSEASYTNTPPTYRLGSTYEYDEAGLSVIRTIYTLTVSSVFHEATADLMDTKAGAVKRLLSEPGKLLKLEGIGIGFEAVGPGGLVPGLGFRSQVVDYAWGPQPLDCQWNPLGPQAWECIWTVRFAVNACSSAIRKTLPFLAFNFETSWANDYEGLTERTIAGYVEIPIRRAVTATVVGWNPLYTADKVRDSLNIVCPFGWRRMRNVWRENIKHNRIEFVVTDAVQPGTELPQGCISADGLVSYQSEGPGFAKAMVQMAMQIRTSPSFHPGIAAGIFWQCAKTKQERMQKGLGDGAVVIPRSIHMSNGKFDRARDSMFSMSWTLTKCVKDMMTAAGIWEPVLDPTLNNYAKWRTSIQNLWNNRGAALVGGTAIRQNPNDVAVITLCRDIDSATIGDQPIKAGAPEVKPSFSFTCPEIAEDGGWIVHDLRVRLVRNDPQTRHRQAVSYNPPQGASGGSANTLADRSPLNGPSYTELNNSPHVIEHSGLPEIYALLEWRTMRLIRKPTIPELDTVAGVKVDLIKESIEQPKIAYDSPCPVWIGRGYRIYGVNGYVPDIAVGKSKTSCAASTTDAESQKA